MSTAWSERIAVVRGDLNFGPCAKPTLIAHPKGDNPSWSTQTASRRQSAA